MNWWDLDYRFYAKFLYFKSTSSDQQAEKIDWGQEHQLYRGGGFEEL